MLHSVSDSFYEDQKHVPTSGFRSRTYNSLCHPLEDSIFKHLAKVVERGLTQRLHRREDRVLVEKYESLIINYKRENHFRDALRLVQEYRVRSKRSSSSIRNVIRKAEEVTTINVNYADSLSRGKLGRTLRRAEINEVLKVGENLINSLEELHSREAVLGLIRRCSNSEEWDLVIVVGSLRIEFYGNFIVWKANGDTPKLILYDMILNVKLLWTHRVGLAMEIALLKADDNFHLVMILEDICKRLDRDNETEGKTIFV